MEWVDLGLRRSDEYWEGQAAVVADRCPKKFRDGSISIPDWHGLCGWLPHFTLILLSLLLNLSILVHEFHYLALSPVRLVASLDHRDKLSNDRNSSWWWEENI
jgi:hypothetical protein